MTVKAYVWSVSFLETTVIAVALLGPDRGIVQVAFTLAVIASTPLVFVGLAFAIRPLLASLASKEQEQGAAFFESHLVRLDHELAEWKSLVSLPSRLRSPGKRGRAP